jgi:hypothetical protein
MTIRCKCGKELGSVDEPCDQCWPSLSSIYRPPVLSSGGVAPSPYEQTDFGPCAECTIKDLQLAQLARSIDRRDTLDDEHRKAILDMIGDAALAADNPSWRRVIEALNKELTELRAIVKADHAHDFDGA